MTSIAAIPGGRVIVIRQSDRTVKLSLIDGALTKRDYFAL